MFLLTYVEWRRRHECSDWRAPQDILLVGASVEAGRLSHFRKYKGQGPFSNSTDSFKARITGLSLEFLNLGYEQREGVECAFDFAPVVSFQALAVTICRGHDGSN